MLENDNLDFYILLIIIVSFGAGFVFGFVYRALMRKFAPKSPHGLAKNIDKSGRISRLIISIILFILPFVFATLGIGPLLLSPVLLFASGFTFFEAVFSWCGFNAALGKSSCPIR